jgi:hypothetical protein
VKRPGDQLIALYDRAYRRLHGLDDSRASVFPLLCVELQRCGRARRLAGGVRLDANDLVGHLHLDKAGVAAIHGHGRSPIAVGLAFRRQMEASLRNLAARADPGEPFADVRAFAAVTIFHRPFRRLGFDVEPEGLTWPRLTAAYQRRLLAWLHPDGLTRLARLTAPRAERLWICREQLIAL